MSIIKNYVTPYIGTFIVVLVALAVLSYISKKAPTATQYFKLS